MNINDIYPEGWPYCPVCLQAAMTDHITCGRVTCDERRCRDAKTAAWRRSRRLLFPGDCELLAWWDSLPGNAVECN